MFGFSNTGLAGLFQGNVTVTGFLSTGNLTLTPGSTLKFSDGTIQSTAFTGQINQSQVTNLIADLSSKANDSGVVHLAGAEAITGAKTFSGFRSFSGNVGIGMHAPTTDTLLNVGGNTCVVAGTSQVIDCFEDGCFPFPFSPISMFKAATQVSIRHPETNLLVQAKS